MHTIKTKEFGELIVRTVPLPEFTILECATYTPSGNVLLSYKMEWDQNDVDYYNLGIMSDDGKNFKKIFHGHIPMSPTANGIRWMVFSDNKRILLGDYVMECIPSIDDCDQVNLYPLIYPEWLIKSEGLWLHWSEVIIGPDNKTMAFTCLGGNKEGNYIANLIKSDKHYELADVKNISSLPSYTQNPAFEGYMIPRIAFGGEVKQFVHGGKAISLAGESYSIAGPSVQHLDKEAVTPYCLWPGYDETLMFSPNERLGLVMSGVHSPATGLHILGHLPRPLISKSLTGLAMPAYGFSVSDPRRFKKGNVGPVLVDTSQAKNNPNYKGVSLHDPSEEWVYYSPISWHPNNSKGMWIERKRPVTNDSKASNTQGRIQIVEIPTLTNTSLNLPEIDDAPLVIPYACHPKDTIPMSKSNPGLIKIKGQYCGEAQIKRELLGSTSQRLETKYINFSNDGLDYYDGTEKVTSPIHYFGTSTYEGGIQVRGKNKGNLDLRLTFIANSPEQAVTFDYTMLDDGKPATYGYAEYNDVRLKVSELL